MTSDNHEPLESSMRERAVAMAKLGYRVFKLQVGGKVPAHEIPLADAASSDPDRVYQMWSDVTGESLHNNIGILVSPGHIVVDVDVKDGKKGAESLQLLELEGLDTDTLEAISPTGSRHLHYTLPPGHEARNTQGKPGVALGAGIDTRGAGDKGYVVGPGSEIGGRPYRWVTDSGKPKKCLPTWVLDLCRKIPQKSTAKRQPLVQLDTPDAVERAISWLTEDAAEAIEGAGGNSTTFRVAARLKDFGLSEVTTFELMAEYWNETKAIPPWNAPDLEKIIGNAYRYGSRPIGVASPHADFEPVELGPSVAAQLWDAAQDPRGTPAEDYLNSCRVDLTDDIAGTVLRYHPQCPWQDNHKPVPTLIVALRAIAGSEIASVLRLRLDRRKRWPKAARRILGPTCGVAAKFDEITGGKLTIGVDVETCLAARQHGLRPMWALGSVCSIAAFQLGPDVTKLRILGEPGSLDAIEICVARWRAAGRCVRVAILDAVADDFNHQLMMR